MVYDTNRLMKLAFSPFTQDAQMAPAPAPAPMPPQGGMPMMQGGAPAPAPAPAPVPQTIQPVPGRNGEPIDPITGFIVLDPAQGIEQDPLTGIIVNVMTGEFMTPDGQPMDPNQAMQMIEQAQMQAQGGQPPMDPTMMQGGAPAPAPAPMPPQGAPAPMPMPKQANAGQTFDPTTGQLIDDATGMPVDQRTGMLIDPSTGQLIDPNTGAIAPGQQQLNMFEDPEIMAQVQDALKEIPGMAKELARVEKQQNASRTDIQGLRREIQTLQDNTDAVLQRIDNTAALIEQLLGANTGMQGIQE